MNNPSNHMNDEVLACYLLNEADIDIRQEVERWIIETPENRRYFEQFKLIFESSKKLVQPVQIDENAAWERFKRRTYNHPQYSTTKSLSYSPRLIRMAAAVFAFALTAALGYMIWQQSTTQKLQVAAGEEIKTEKLPDGSEVTLNKRSTITYSSATLSKSRNIRLSGEAHFRVTLNKNKPFVVNVNNVKVTVLGTVFNVKGFEGRTEVIVESGSVLVETGNTSTILNRGDKASVGINDSVIKNSRVTDKLHSYYITKEFVCDNTPLWKLVEVLNEAYGTKIIIQNPAIADLPLTTTFHNEPLDNILKVIRETFSITIMREGDTIIMR